jgi:hypothetical protein
MKIFWKHWAMPVTLFCLAGCLVGCNNERRVDPSKVSPELAPTGADKPPQGAERQTGGSTSQPPPGHGGNTGLAPNMGGPPPGPGR